MKDLQERVRNTLHDMAAEVPASPRARADLDRRLAGRRRGRSTGLAVAAAAAVVVAAVAIPVAMTGDAARQTDGATTTPPLLTSPVPTGGQGTEADPLVITTITEGGVEKTAVYWTTTGSEPLMCLALRPVAENDPASPPGPDCQPVPATWPVHLGPGSDMKVLTGGVLSDYIGKAGPAPLRNWLRFTTAPEITRLEVQAGDGTPVPLTGPVRLPDGAMVHFANFGAATPWGFGYTAYDAHGNVVESAIT